MEANIEGIKRKITQIADKFNLDEVDEALKNEIEKVLLVSKNTDNVNKLNDIENWFSELHYKWKKECEKRNLRYIKFNFIDGRVKYTNFYNLIRTLAENPKPESIWSKQLQNISWQVLDMAILQLETDFEASLREETDLLWTDKITEYFSIDNDNFWYNVVELVDLKKIIDGVDDYYIKEVITKDYFYGFDEEPDSNEEEPERFLSRESQQELMLPLEEVINETTDKLNGLVSDAVNALGKIIIDTYTLKDLMTVLEIDEGYIKEFSKWYDCLGIDLSKL